MWDGCVTEQCMLQRPAHMEKQRQNQQQDRRKQRPQPFHWRLRCEAHACGSRMGVIAESYRRTRGASGSPETRRALADTRSRPGLWLVACGNLVRSPSCLWPIALGRDGHQDRGGIASAKTRIEEPHQLMNCTVTPDPPVMDVTLARRKFARTPDTLRVSPAVAVDVSRVA